jgi:hypothetical protein
MPNFRMYGVDVDVDIDVDEFLDDCSEKDIKNVIEWLKDSDYLDNIPDSSTDNIMDITYKNALNKLYTKRVNLSLEEEEFLINLANKF